MQREPFPGQGDAGWAWGYLQHRKADGHCLKSTKAPLGLGNSFCVSRVTQAKSLPHWKKAPLCDQLLGPLRMWTKTPWKQMNTLVVLRGSGTSPGQAATGLCKNSPAAHAAVSGSILGHLLHQNSSPEPLLHIPCLAPLCHPQGSPHKGWCAVTPQRKVLEKYLPGQS